MSKLPIQIDFTDLTTKIGISSLQNAITHFKNTEVCSKKTNSNTI